MSGQRYTPELKGEVAKLVSERRYSVTYKMWTPI